MAECVACYGHTLGAVREPVERFTPVFCSSCGTLMVVDVIASRPIVRRPTPLEATILRDDCDVKRFYDAFILEQVDAAGNLKAKAPERTDGPGLLEELERGRRPE